jgi:hypothetical protein
MKKTGTRSHGKTFGRRLRRIRRAERRDLAPTPIFSPRRFRLSSSTKVAVVGIYLWAEFEVVTGRYCGRPEANSYRITDHSLLSSRQRGVWAALLPTIAGARGEVAVDTEHPLGEQPDQGPPRISGMETDCECKRRVHAQLRTRLPAGSSDRGGGHRSRAAPQ